MNSNITFISAGAGSGKTYALTQTLEKILVDAEVAPHEVMATTFTRLAAGELQERVRGKLIESGQLELANQMEQALVGTVNSVCGELLQRFAFEAGLPPELKVIDEEDNALLLNAAMESALADTPGLTDAMNAAATRLDVVDQADPQRPLAWRREVRKIVTQARANNQDAVTVRARGPASADALLANFRAPVSRDLDAQMLGALQKADAAIRASRESAGDTTQATDKYLDKLREGMFALRNGRMKWPAWYSLVDAKPGAKSGAHAESVQQLAQDVDVHPGLQIEIRAFTENLFAIAAQTMEAYQALKTRKGLIDFVDQEQQVYTLLDNETVNATLRQQYKVLLVDEFQDTSPIQLALFLKLSRMVERVIWVGDIKQSIYGFRGSDPALMKAVVERVLQQGNPPQILEHSWRSTPALVAYSNALFAPAFANTLQREQVVLHAQRKEDAPPGASQASVERWTLIGRRKEQRAQALAAAILECLRSGRQVYDKSQECWREIRYADIAVLCRTNINLEAVANALSHARLPVRYKRPGLLQTPEGALAMACLRRMLDPSDTLASAEIHCLWRCENAENWIAARLEYLRDAQHKPARWLEDEPGHPVANLKQARQRLDFLSPVEALRAAIDAGDVRKAVYRWGPDEGQAQHRLNNLAELVAHAEAFEQRAATFSEPVTALGLVFWLQRLGEDATDTQASGGNENAIHLVTHHGAKGLEWPVVIAADLDSELKPRVWGLSVQARAGEVDLADPLAGRTLEYWCDFSNNKKPVTPLLETIAGSDRASMAQQQEIEESRRLLYVSLTRARDALVLPLPKKPKAGSWMDCVDTNVLVPGGDTLQLPGDAIIQTAVREYSEDSAIEPIEQAFKPKWIRTGDAGHALLPLNLSPSSVAPETAAKTGRILALGDALETRGDYAADVMGSALHAVIATRLSGQVATARVLRQHGMLECIDEQTADDCAERFARCIEEQFQPLSVAVEYPLRYANECGQHVQGWIDCLLETAQGWVIVDHKSTPVGEAGWQELALKYAGQLACYADGVQRVSGKPVASAWVHFALAGGMVELVL